ncbi:uncharacterized protein VDAG_08826 [Verticillium dahliae VdLs.17]|uniref:Uncharacterized protein n=1 Tax=Verticillium dahliae (strain VdLs.17 / ATCC MYA-4575 / FGSC 10137) TaxID=498257 RepID=G2XF94_VERDV|nr:uncharacterized protein VDAG_08826 [Verticillium dahliae VdLs.17]EGY18492.1 hypothetical protein VDAG_08826 [Verticillium dahliae VdLs.17]KAH6688186.1 hypothetical protein EV126DRAFT_125581 [Verticillium dahliae]
MTCDACHERSGATDTMFRKADIGATSMAGGWILGASWRTRWSSGHDRLSLIWKKKISLHLLQQRDEKECEGKIFDNWRYGWAFSLPLILQRGRGISDPGARQEGPSTIKRLRSGRESEAASALRLARGKHEQRCASLPAPRVCFTRNC